MDLEQLTKHQIILLTLLVSFVTSIATGIVTVSLMDQAPPGVTKIVNQIVEHTIETVNPQSQGAAAAMTTEKTVVVKDDDLTAQSISTVQKAIIRITKVGGKELIARGVITDKGTAVTDAEALRASGTTTFDAILPSGDRVPATLVTSATTSPVAILSVAFGTSTGYAIAKAADLSSLKLGQSVIRIGGAGADTVGSGVIASLPRNDDGTQTQIEATVASATPGSIIITLFGEVIGITTGSSALTGDDFYSILNASKAVTAPSKPADTSSQS